MLDFKLGNIETKFADLIWDNEPIQSGELVKLCNEQLNWKKSTTYTVLKKLSEKGLFKNENGKITSLISKKEYFSMQSESFINDTFNGSLPAFIASFTSRKELSNEEIDEIQNMINSFRKEDYYDYILF